MSKLVRRDDYTLTGNLPDTDRPVVKLSASYYGSTWTPKDNESCKVTIKIESGPSTMELRLSKVQASIFSEMATQIPKLIEDRDRENIEAKKKEDAEEAAKEAAEAIAKEAKEAAESDAAIIAEARAADDRVEG